MNELRKQNVCTNALLTVPGLYPFSPENTFLQKNARPVTYARPGIVRISSSTPQSITCTIKMF